MKLCEILDFGTTVVVKIFKTYILLLFIFNKSYQHKVKQIIPKTSCSLKTNQVSSSDTTTSIKTKRQQDNLNNTVTIKHEYKYEKINRCSPTCPPPQWCYNFCALILFVEYKTTTISILSLLQGHE